MILNSRDFEGRQKAAHCTAEAWLFSLTASKSLVQAETCHAQGKCRAVDMWHGNMNRGTKCARLGPARKARACAGRFPGKSLGR